MPLPAATTFIEIDHQPQPFVSISDTTKVSFAKVSLSLLDGTPTISDENVAGKEGGDSADEDPVGNDTVLADEAILTVNEVEEALRDAFAEADHSGSVKNDQGSISVGKDLTLVSPGLSPDCIGVRHCPVCRGASHEHTSKVKPKRHDPRSFCRSGTAPRRISDQGNDLLH